MTLNHSLQNNKYKSKNFAISAQYRKPAGDFKQYKTYLENFLNKIKNSNKAIQWYIVGDIQCNIYIVGDTNLKLIN